jgi:cytidylate kinase
LKNVNQNLKITCDGGAATGKTTGAKLLAKKYNLKFLSSGLLYRYASYLILKFKPKKETLFLKKKFKNLNYKRLNKINLHSPRISNYSAIIAKKIAIRNILKAYQIKFINSNSRCVLEGRDASTKILPNSDLKFFFICNLKIAAKRRFTELKKLSPKINETDVKKALKLRNILDKKRKHSPLKKHKNAIIVDTGKLNKTMMVTKMSKHVEKILKNKYGK